MSAREIVNEFYFKQFPADRSVFFRDIIKTSPASFNETATIMSQHSSPGISRLPSASFLDAESFVEFLFHSLWVQNWKFGPSIPVAEKVEDEKDNADKVEHALNVIGDALVDTRSIHCRYVRLGQGSDNSTGTGHNRLRIFV